MGADVVEKTLKTQEKFERDVAQWRETKGDVGPLKKELHHAMQDELFNSAVLLRLNTELLLHEDSPVEVRASFYAYMEAQHLAVLTANSGAQAFPDSQEHCLELMATVLTYTQSRGGEAAILAAQDISDRTESMYKAFDDPNEPSFAALRGRVAVSRMLHSQSDDEYRKWIKEAHNSFHKAELNVDPENSTDSEALYAYALLLALTGTASAAFPLAKAAVKLNSQNSRYALLFAQVLSADEQSDAALKLSQAIFSTHEVTKKSSLLLVDRIALLELKKTQILLLEEIHGAKDAISELLQFIDLLAELFESPSHSPGTQSKPEPKTMRKHWTFFGSRSVSARENGVENLENSTDSSSAGQKSARAVNYQLQEDDARVVSQSWLWISRQYAKFGFEDDAREALRSVEGTIPISNELEGFAEIKTMLGLLESRPEVALAKFRDALQASPSNVAAGVATARALAEIDGELNELDRELALTVSSTLEAACNQFPGRVESDVWHARGLILEKLGSHVDARAAFWRLVELEERKAITSFIIIV